MKIGIVSNARTGASMIGSLFAHKYNLTDYSELFSSGPIEGTTEEKLAMLRENDDYSVKITSTTFLTNADHFDYTTFPWQVFDRIILVERANVAAHASSWLLLSHAQRTGLSENAEIAAYLNIQLQTPEILPVNRGELQYIVKTSMLYSECVKPYLLQSNLPVSIVDHELIQTSPTEYLESLNQQLGIELVLEDVATFARTNYIDYSPYITAHNLTAVIEEIQHEIINAAKETGDTRPTEGEGSI